MPNVVLLAGSTNPQSRSTQLLQHSALVLAAEGVSSEFVSIADFPPQALIQGWKHANEIASFLLQIAEADGLIVATPIYKAAYSGVLKVLLDLLPERALSGKAVMPLAVGGGPAHTLALDYALRPVLSSLKPRVLVDGVYGIDTQIEKLPGGALRLDEDLRGRLDGSLARFVEALPEREVGRHGLIHAPRSHAVALNA
ncbi:NADPH-dependent FMN reductase [Chitinimonas sp.]|uniref:NADPH-dependent FMN reductase n=1 Tax=Chitinimonas sp. TaxID=1934313 RepID=UPI002F94834C